MPPDALPRRNGRRTPAEPSERNTGEARAASGRIQGQPENEPESQATGRPLGYRHPCPADAGQGCFAVGGAGGLD